MISLKVKLISSMGVIFMQVRKLTLAALFAALTAVFSQIAIPTPWQVPINLATMAVFLSGVVLGARWGAASQLTFLALGLCGAPVFSGFKGGMAVLAGPTGGYLVGYVLAALAVGLLAKRLSGRAVLPFAMACGLVLCYALGTAWFMVSTQSGLIRSLTLCVLPFLPGDALKIAAASLLAPRLTGLLAQEHTA